MVYCEASKCIQSWLKDLQPMPGREIMHPEFQKQKEPTEQKKWINKQMPAWK